MRDACLTHANRGASTHTIELVQVMDMVGRASYGQVRVVWFVYVCGV